MMTPFEGVKVFSATKGRDRDMLGESVTDWMRANADLEIVDKVVTQSSDCEYHCITITLFYVFPKQPSHKLRSTH
jgi:hypothetical protein